MQLTYIFLLIFFLFIFFYIRKKYIKYKLIYQKNGLDGILYYFKNKNFKKTGFSNFIDKKKYLLGKKISEYSNQKVLFGPYSGTKFLNLDGWTKLDFSSKYLGSYESQIQSKIIFLSKKFNLNCIVDLGAAEGYHLISLLRKKVFKKGLAYEINSKSRDILEKNAKINKVNKKITIHKQADFNSLKKNLAKSNLNKTLFLVDIEGNEFFLFDEEFCKYFSKSFFIIEDHNFNIRNNKIKKKFYITLKKFYKFDIIENKTKNPFEYKILDKFTDDEKYLMMSEGRPETMSWIILTPKKK